jgi:hypothetical protein
MYGSTYKPGCTAEWCGWGDWGRSAAWCVVERTYFDRVAGEAEDRLGVGGDPRQ